MAADPPIVIVKSYDDFIGALRARKSELKLSDGTIDALTGLTSGHTGKILGPSQVKLLGRVSMGLLLQALGLMLVVVEDPEQRALMQSRYVPRREKNVRDFNHAQRLSIGLIQRVAPELFSSLGKRGANARQIKLSPWKRRRIARHAANMRWRRKGRAKGSAASAQPPLLRKPRLARRAPVDIGRPVPDELARDVGERGDFGRRGDAKL